MTLTFTHSCIIQPQAHTRRKKHVKKSISNNNNANKDSQIMAVRLFSRQLSQRLRRLLIYIRCSKNER